MPSTTVLVLAAHADDETWGCGGSIAKWTAAGASVRVELVTRPYGDGDVAVRAQEFKRACAYLGAEPYTHACATDGYLWKAITETVQMMDAICKRVNPTVILAPCASSHADHRALQSIAIALARPHRYSGSLLFYQAGFEKQDDGPCVYVDITDTRAAKFKALLCYESQIEAKSLDPLAVEQVDRVNGLRCGHPTAEVFVPYRMLWEPV